MNPDHEKLLEEFETFKLDLEVEEILKKVKADRVPDQSPSVCRRVGAKRSTETGGSGGKTGPSPTTVVTGALPAADLRLVYRRPRFLL